MSHIRPMIISIWCGTQKPNDLTEYLKPFVDELNILLENGIFVNGYHIAIAFRSCICDSPARALIKGNIDKQLLKSTNFLSMIFVSIIAN